MPRDDRLVRLSRDHHHALVLSLRIQRELPGADDHAITALIGDTVRYWTSSLQPHIEVENEAFLASLAMQGDEGLALAGRLQREHRELDEAMTAIRNGGVPARQGRDRRAALERFGALLGAHIRWEERELFEWMQECLGTEQLEQAGALFAARLPAVPVVCPTPQTL